MNFDLHMHTNYSSGKNQDVNDVLDKCAEAGLNIVSLTDHDSCECFNHINKTKYKGKIICGMEANAMIGKVTYDILCYDFDIKKINKWSKKIYPQDGHNQEIIFNALIDLCHKNNIKYDDSIPYDPINEYAHSAILRMLEPIPESKKLLKSFGITNVTELYHIGTVNENFPLFVDMHILWPDIEELKRVVHAAGGKIFMAHPFKCNRDVKEVLKACIWNVDGIEISNEPENKEQVEILYKFAKENNLLVSAGNDYCGTAKHLELGTKYLTDEMKEDILSWVNNCTNMLEL